MMNCWMCDPKKYTFVEHQDFRVSRLVFENDSTFVTVPRESHVKHHLLVVLKPQDAQHKNSLIECSASDLAALGSTIVKCCQTLKRMGYDTVYTGCYSDSGHAHFHLIPFKHSIDKGYPGKAMKWLAEKEEKSNSKRFDSLNEANKLARLKEVKTIVAELKQKFMC
jgi:diadenosine tetraphosphate (Ap4A) HIT family hydrolase